MKVFGRNNGEDKLTKQDLVDAGLDPDKLVLFQEKGVTKDDLNTMKSELTTSITEQIKAGFTELETKLRTSPKKEATNDGGSGEGGGNNNEDIDALTFMEDPMKHVRDETNKIRNANAVESKKMLYDMAYEKLSGELRGFKNEELKKEIDAELARYTPQIMVALNTDPRMLIRNIHDKVMGAHFDDIQRDTAKKEGKFSLVHSGSSGNVNTSTDNKGKEPGDDLTEDELMLAKKFDMTPKEWAEAKLVQQ